MVLSFLLLISYSIHAHESHCLSGFYYYVSCHGKNFPFQGNAAIIASPVALTLSTIPEYG